MAEKKTNVKNLLSFRRVVRQAFADYVASEGCSCCQDTTRHGVAADKLGKLLGVPKYKDDSGYDFYRFKTKEIPNG